MNPPWEMKEGVRIFNCARGGIIKESALIDALKSGKVASAGLGHIRKGTLDENHEFRKLDNLALTPHLGPPRLSAGKCWC